MRFALLAGGLLRGLAGCTVSEERTAQMEASCRTYGFTPDTEAFAACMRQQMMSVDPQLFDRRNAMRAGTPGSCVRPLGGHTVAC